MGVGASRGGLDGTRGLADSLASELDRMISADDRNGLLASTFLASQPALLLRSRSGLGGGPSTAASRLGRQSRKGS